jgi:phosphate starvation-inducible protein PhoH
MIICGDDAQVDLKNKKDTGFKFLYQNAHKINGLAAMTLKTNHRDPIVDELINLYEEEQSKKINK